MLIIYSFVFFRTIFSSVDEREEIFGILLQDVDMRMLFGKFQNFGTFWT